MGPGRTTLFTRKGPPFAVPAEATDRSWIEDRVQDALLAAGHARGEVRSVDTTWREHSILHDCIVDAARDADGTGATGHSLRIVVKVGLHWTSEDARAVLTHAREIHGRLGEGTSVPEHLGWWPDPPTVVMRHVDGETLNSRLVAATRASSPSRVAADLAAFGRALGAYHRATVDLAQARDRRRARRANEALALRWLVDPRRVGPSPALTVKAVRDLHFDNALVHRDQVTMIDLWPRALFRSPHRDLGMVRYKVDRLALKAHRAERPALRRTLWPAFLDGYEVRGPLDRLGPADLRLLHLWYADAWRRDGWHALRSRQLRLGAGRCRRAVRIRLTEI